MVILIHYPSPNHLPTDWLISPPTRDWLTSNETQCSWDISGVHEVQCVNLSLTSQEWGCFISFNMDEQPRDTPVIPTKPLSTFYSIDQILGHNHASHQIISHSQHVKGKYFFKNEVFRLLRNPNEIFDHLCQH